MNMEPIETVSYGVHIRKVLKIYVIGRVCALFVPMFLFAHNFIPAAKSPLLKNFILIMEVKISGILEIIYIA